MLKCDSVEGGEVGRLMIQSLRLASTLQLLSTFVQFSDLEQGNKHTKIRL